MDFLNIPCNKDSDFLKIDFDFDVFNLGNELNTYSDYSEITAPFHYSIEDLFDISNDLELKDESDYENIKNIDNKIKLENKKKRKKDFNIQHNNEEYKRKKSVRKCPRCSKIFYNGHALGGHLKYCNKKIN